MVAFSKAQAQPCKEEILKKKLLSEVTKDFNGNQPDITNPTNQ